MESTGVLGMASVIQWKKSECWFENRRIKIKMSWHCKRHESTQLLIINCAMCSERPPNGKKMSGFPLEISLKKMWISSDKKKDAMSLENSNISPYIYSNCSCLTVILFFCKQKIAKKGRKQQLGTDYVSFFTICLKAQKSFNYYTIKMKSKLAYVILKSKNTTVLVCKIKV